jgi:LmbE family N-acetylglucosaminyl deacetylase
MPKRTVEQALGLVGAVSNPRVLIVAAHPDDETIGAAGLLQKLSARGVAVRVVHVTDGSASRNLENSPIWQRQYAFARNCEFAAAMRCLRIAPESVSLGFGDQRSSEQIIAVAESIRELVDSWRPTAILTHPYEGGHPDHDSTALATVLALDSLRRKCRMEMCLAEFTSYHLWQGAIRTGVFLPRADAREICVRLDALERRTKRRMLRCFRTQRNTLNYFPVLDTETFRAAPRYDFRRPPHEGKLFYDLFDWGTTSPEWCRRAEAALDAAGAGMLAWQ